MKKLFSWLLALGTCLALLPATAFAETQPATQVDRITIAINNTQGPYTPFSDCSSKSWELIGLVYDNLYEMDSNRNYQPGLAKSYTFSEDHTSYTFQLRDDVKWHDGTPFTAEDVKFSYDLTANVVNSVNFTGPSKMIKEIKIPDPYTIEFVFESPKSEEVIENMFGYMPIVAKHAYEGLSADEIKKADIRVGTGPYVITDMKEDEFYKLEANPNYFGGTPVAKELIFPIIKDKTAAFTALKSHQVDALMTGLTAEIIDQFSADSTLKVVTGVGYGSTLMFMNESRAPFDQKEFRQAVSFAVNVDELVSTVLLGRGTPGSPGFVSSKDKLYNPATPQHVYDPAEAAALLDQSGYKDTNSDGLRETPAGEKMVLGLLCNSSNALQTRAAEMIKEYLGKVGIGVDLRALESGVVDSLVAPNWDGVADGDYDMTMWGWGDVFMTTPSRYVEQFHSDPKFGPSNLTRVKQADLDAILERVLSEVELEKRDQALDEMQLYLADHTTMVPLYYADVAYAYDPSVYDGWRITKGRSYVNKQSLVNLTNAVPAEVSLVSQEQEQSQPGDSSSAQPTSTSPGQTAPNNTGVYVLGAIVVAVVIALIMVFRKKNK